MTDDRSGQSGPGTPDRARELYEAHFWPRITAYWERELWWKSRQEPAMSDNREADRQAWAALSVEERAKIFLHLPRPAGEHLRVARVDGAWQIVADDEEAEAAREFEALRARVDPGAWKGAGVRSSMSDDREAIAQARADLRARAAGVVTVTESGVLTLEPSSPAGLAEVLAAFTVRDPWTQLSVLLSPQDALDGRSILDALHAGEVQAAVGVANSFGNTGS